MKIHDSKVSQKSILYVEENYNQSVNEFIIENYDLIVKHFHNDFDIRFLYLPYVLKDKDYIEQLQYNHPTFEPALLDQTDIIDIYRDIINEHNRKGINCALVSYDDEGTGDIDLIKKINPSEDLVAQFYYFAQSSRELMIRNASNSSSMMGFITRSEYDVLRDELSNLFEGDYETYLNRMEKGAFKNVNEVCIGLTGVANDISKSKLSRIQITGSKGKYKIFLLDYKGPNGPKEIKMGALPLTFFVFYLNRPKGVKFADLPAYVNDLNNIYAQISTRIPIKPTGISPTINKLVKYKDNSKSEQENAIKEAFIKEISPLIATNYHIVGKAEEIKTITLPRHLLYMDPKLQGL